MDLTRAVGLEAGLHSLDEARRIVGEFLETWDSTRFEAFEMWDSGDDAMNRFTNYHRGRDGIEVQARGYWAWTIRDGVVARVCFCADKAQALEAVGLSE